MYIAEIWRYPVKSMAGERLDEVTIGAAGLDGDRLLHVEDARGRVITARTHGRLLRHHARTSPDGVVLVDGRPWFDPEVARDLAVIAGPGSQLAPTDEGLFDILPLLVATDGAIAAFGHDGRRLRPNLVIGGVDGLAERAWEGAGLRVGDLVIEAVDLRGRCVMTTFDPDTGVQDPDVLRSIVRRFEGRLALNARVVTPGRIRRGDPVELLPASALAR